MNIAQKILGTFDDYIKENLLSPRQIASEIVSYFFKDKELCEAVAEEMLPQLKLYNVIKEVVNERAHAYRFHDCFTHDQLINLYVDLNEDGICILAEILVFLGVPEELEETFSIPENNPHEQALNKINEWLKSENYIEYKPNLKGRN